LNLLFLNKKVEATLSLKLGLESSLLTTSLPINPALVEIMAFMCLAIHIHFCSSANATGPTFFFDIFGQVSVDYVFKIRNSLYIMG
jgi:hypothetical protein